MTRFVLDVDDSQWKADHLPRVLRTTESEWLNELAYQVEIQIADGHPLIVLDLKGMNPTPILTGFLREVGYDWLALQIEAQTKPARIPEPEPGEHVTACVMPTPDHPETFLHLRLQKLRNETPYDWACLATGHCYMWDSLIDPTLIREGLS